MSRSVPTALLCWEGGGGRGHLNRLRRLALALRARGVACRAALFDVSRAAVLSGAVDEVVSAPAERWGDGQPPKLQLSPDPRDACNTTFTLWELGFWRGETVAANLRGWDALFARIRPDVIVADLAPFALLAAAGRLPTLAVGNGYFVPACRDGYFTPDGEPPSKQDRIAQDGFFAVVRAAFAAVGLSAPPDVARALCSDSPSPATLPALDPRYALRRDRLVPPELDVVPSGPVPGVVGSEVLAYFGIDVRGHIAAIRALASAGLRVTLHAEEPASVAGLLPDGVVLRPTPFTIAEIAARARLFVHHGGVGAVHLAALAGIPQLAAYRGHERWHNTRAVWSVGAGDGRCVDAGDTTELDQVARRLAEPGLHREAARTWAVHALDWMAGRRGQDVVAERVLAAPR